MDITSWVTVTGDPMGQVRLSLVLFAMAFYIIGILLWYISIPLVKYALHDPEGTAKKLGFRDYPDLHYQITRVSFGLACVFLATVCLVFFFTQYYDIMEGATKVYHEYYWEECSKMGGSVSCFKVTGGQVEQLFNRSITNWSWSPQPIEHKANST